MRKTADTAQVKLWLGKEPGNPPEDVPPDFVPAIEYLITMFQSRYQRFKQEGFPLTSLDHPGILYPISGVLDPVLKAVDMQAQAQENSVAGLFQKPGRV
jgi:hypothetical protein